MFRWLDELLHLEQPAGPGRQAWEKQLELFDGIFGVAYRSGAIKAYTDMRAQSPEELVEDVLILSIDHAEQRNKWDTVHALEDRNVRHGFYLAFYAGWNDALADLGDHTQALRRNDADSRAAAMWSAQKDRLLPLVRREVGLAPDPAAARRAAQATRRAAVSIWDAARAAGASIARRTHARTHARAEAFAQRRAPSAPATTRRASPPAASASASASAPMQATTRHPQNVVDISRASKRTTRRA